MLYGEARGMRRVLGIFLCEIFACLGKRGELRCGGVLLAPKPSSFSKALKCLSSPVLPFFIGLLLWVAPISTQAAICFLPDCKDKKMEFVQTGADVCVSSGYYSILDVTCSQYSKTEFCPENTSYIKCDNVAWCQENGYNTTECSVPQYVSDQCPNGEALYRECVDDFARACSDLNSEYVLECEVGYTKSEGGECPYSSDYGKCCNLCEDFPYLASEIGQGYLLGDSCEACGEVTKYKRVVNPCAGYMSCPEGGKTGASTCWHGEDKWYSECCSPCEAYDYTIDTIPQGYVAGASCDSCTGMKYMLAEGRCAEGYEWKNGSCVTCVASCAVGNILYSDYSCNSCVVEGKTAIGIIALEQGSKKVALSLTSNGMYWSNDTVDVVGLNNLTEVSEAVADYNGKENTQFIISQYGTSASANAGVYCYNYVTSGTSSKQWYLPAAGELYVAIYTNKGVVNDNLTSLGKDALNSSNYWSSSESNYAENAWVVSGDNGATTLGYKPSAGNVACALAFEDNGNGTAEICAPEYAYLCTPDEEKNIVGGSGATCAGMYASCLCVTGSVWQNGACVCDDTCSVGNILYSDYSCSACLYDDRTPIGVIVKNDGTAGLALSVERKSMFWSADAVDVTYLANYNTVDEAKTDSLGKENTKIIVDFYGDTAVETSNAALYCYNYTTAGTSAHQWYLGAVNELYFNVYMNYNTLSTAFVNKLGWTGFSWNFWSSTEMKASDAWSVQSETGGVYYGNGKQEDRSVSCMLSFNLNGVGEVDICDGDYLYACDGENMSGGADTGCGGLYKSCECDSGYTAYKGLCCDMTCAVGNIMYSDMTCSSCLITEKTPIGVVVKSDGANSLVMSNRTGNIQWGGYGTDISTLTNYSSDTVAKTDFSGKDNTAKIVAHFGENVDTSLHAGVFCHKYVTEGTNAGNWYLPAAGEVYSYMYNNYSKIKTAMDTIGWGYNNYSFWSSSEVDSSYAINVNTNDGRVNIYIKTFSGSASCFLGVSIGDDGKAEVCENTYLYPCVGTGYVSGVGESCGGLYSACTCEIGYDYADGKCTLCDAKYVYACVGEHQTAGVGEGCGGLYEACECEDGYGFKDGVCGLCEDTFTFECVSNGTDNITGGAGESCSGKYEACTCSEGYEFTLGQCCDNTCKVGNILYSDMTCSSCVFDSKTPIGVVVKENELVASLDLQYQYWADDYLNISGITEITDSSVAQVDMRGKEHTIAIVTDYGTEVDVSSNAGVYCYNYAPVGMESIKNQWYLPSAGELYEYFYGDGINYAKINEAWTKLGISWTSVWFWTSSEYSDDSAWRVNYSTGQITPNDKDSYTSSVSCLLGINVGGDGSVEVCDPEYMYTCDGTNASGVGEACGGLYKSCECANDTGWYINDCVDCDETKYKYSCTVGTGNVTAGVGYSCGGLYESCECDSGYYWDSTTGACVGCDAKYQYTCESTGSDNIVGTGEECGGFYSTCLCADGYGWENGACVTCVDTCEVGHILYSDMTCSSCVLPSKTAIGIVVKDNELVMSNKRSSIMTWSSSKTDVVGIIDIIDKEMAKVDYNGKANTLAILETFPSDTVSNNAAIYCNSYSTEGTSVGNWYLPAVGELYSYIPSNYDAISYTWINKLAWDTSFYYALWSSSERSDSTVWDIISGSRNVNYNTKSGQDSVVCFLGVSIGDDGKAEVCDNTYLYACNGTGYAGGSGEGCGGLYTACTCAAGYEWIDGACVACGDTYKYACSVDAATFTTGGAGESCGGLYESCECSTGYGWSADDESCAACDEKYQYACTPDETAHIVGGGDDTCGGSYSACECAEGYAWSGTQCCSTTCTVGAILYSDMTCSECLFADKTPIGVVVKDNELVMSQMFGYADWCSSYNSTDIPKLTNFATADEAKLDTNGKPNTAIIVKSLTNKGLTASNSVAISCYEYSTEATGAGDWYLPAAGELSNYVGMNYSKINTTMRILGWNYSITRLWASTEAGNYAKWTVGSSGGGLSSTTSGMEKYSCFLGINIGDDGKAEVCDSSYKNLCNGTGETAVGETCGGYYSACTCAEGYVWSGSKCCTMACTVGAILYSDMTCSECLFDNKTPIGVIVKDNELAMSNKRNTAMSWYNGGINQPSGITSTSDSTIAQQDFRGKSNTVIAVSAYADTTSNTIDNTAPIYCNSYLTEGTTAGQWYLPAAGELYSYVIGNYSTISSTWSTELEWNGHISNIWSSTLAGYSEAWIMYSSSLSTSSRSSTNSVSCFLGLNVKEDGSVETCDGDFSYNCGTYENTTGGVGEACGGHYSACTCESGYQWLADDGVYKCCDMSCSAGNALYSDMTCSNCKLSGKTVIGVIVKDNELAMSKQFTGGFWGSGDIRGIPNISDAETAKTDFKGKENTIAIVSQLTNSDSPAIVCNTYSTEGTTAGQWYLPALGEIFSYYRYFSNFSNKFNIHYNSGHIMSSSEKDSSNLWAYYSYDRRVTSYSKGQSGGNNYACFLPLNVSDDGKIEICDSKYVYSCSHTNATGGVGETCNGYYETCTCAEGYEWHVIGSLGQCCDMSCSVGNILYSDMTCSECKIDGKTPIGVIVRNTDGNAAAMSIGQYQAYWATSSDYADISEITNNTSSSNAKTDYNGMANTEAIVAKYGADADEATHAGVYCYNYETEGTTAGQWYLPAAGEWRRDVWDNYSILSAKYSTLGSNYLSNRFWLSSEYNSYRAWYAYYTSSSNYDVSYGYKYDLQYYVNCFLPFQVGEDGSVETCESSYKYTCTSSSTTTGGSGENCGGHYESCECASGYYWSGIACTKCDSSYQYTCEGDDTNHIVGGGDDSCGGFYKTCTCADGYGWGGTKCCSKTSAVCTVGTILYSDMTCSECLFEDKTPVGIVVKDNELVMGMDWGENKPWAEVKDDILPQPNFSSSTLAALDNGGRANTKYIVNHYGANVDNAGTYCYNYAPEALESSKHSWYLPAAGEITDSFGANFSSLRNMYAQEFNWSKLPYGFWSSSELSGDYAWGCASNTNGNEFSSCTFGKGKTDKKSVICYLPINIVDSRAEICGDEYIYPCTESSTVVGGIGESCAGYYTACECIDGYVNHEGKCCDDTCSLGNFLYSDMTCSSCMLEDKTIIGVVVKNTDGSALAMNVDEVKITWAATSGDISGITNITSSSTAQNNYDGKLNTQAIFDYYGENTDTSTNAGVYCYNYETEGTTAGQWYLPSFGELYNYGYLNYIVLDAVYEGLLGYDTWYAGVWTSTEYNSNSAWQINIYSTTNNTYKTKTSYSNYVWCFLPFQVGEDGSVETCENTYKYTCTSSSTTTGGSGEGCGGHYESCECASGYYWSGTACMKCDAKYQYECVANADAGIVSGIGSSCGGLYSLCECAEGYGWENGECLACDSSCSIGNILFSDGTCSSCNLSSKTPIGVIGYESGTKKLAVALDNRKMTWTPQNRDVPTLTNITSSSTVKTDYNGKYNTKSILEYYGKNTAGVAARYCYNYVTSGTTAGQWYLPAMGELYDILYSNRTAINNRLKWMDMTQLPSTSSDYYWSSTEYSSDYAWYFYSTSSLSYTSKLNNYIAQCVIPFEDKDDGTAKICGAEYQYECVYDEVAGVLGGVGDTCIGMYSSCECSDGREYINGKCCDNTCEVGNILYSDMTCSSCKIDGKIPVGVVAYANGTTRMAIDLENMKGKWSPDNVTIGTSTTGGMAGKANTQMIVEHYGEDAEDVAAVDCYNYKATDWDEHLWYLPARGEGEAMKTTAVVNKINSGFATLAKTGINLTSNYTYWSSTEYSNSPSSSAVPVYYGSSTSGAGANKVSNYNFKCMLSFEETTTGKADVCSNSYAFACTGTNETPKGVACGGKYKECSCTNGYGWSGTSCEDCSNPWGTTFKYTCDGTNQIGGIGETCGGLYEFCECAEGYSWRNGKCEDCSADCAVGDIVYSDLTCSGCVEEGKTPVGVIMYAEGDARIAMSLDTFRSKWNADDANVVGIPDLYDGETNDVSGIIYTQAIVEQYGENAEDNAGVTCYNYAPAGIGKNSWYLPSAGRIDDLCYQSSNHTDKVYVMMNKVKRIWGKDELFKTDSDEDRIFSSLERSDYARVFVKNCKKPSSNWTARKSNELGFVCTLSLNYVKDNKVKICSPEYKYTCSGGFNNGGEGESCGGRYKSCLCQKGYKNYNGKCCRTTCEQGDFYYSDHTCSSCLIKEKTAIGVVRGQTGNYDAVLVRSLDIFKNKWAPDYVDIETGSNPGLTATKKIVEHYGDDATDVAAVDCYNYVTEGTQKGQWYLPGTTLSTDFSHSTTRESLITSLGLLGIDWNDDLYEDFLTSISVNKETISGWVWGLNGGDARAYKKDEEHYFYCYLSLEYNPVDDKAYICGEEYDKVCRDYYSVGVGNSCGLWYYKDCKCQDSYEYYLDSCIRCEDKYKYKCTYDINTHVVQGVGESCGGLYEACECEDGYTWNEGACVFGTPVVPEEPDNPTSCSDDYKYECLGEGYIGGSGTSCNNLYASCECAEGYKWENGECVSMCEHGYVMVDGVCICDTSCAVGNILYSDMSCSGCVVENKTPIGIIAIAQDNARYALSLNTKSTAGWAKNSIDIAGLKNYTKAVEAVKDFSGRLNTKEVVDYYGAPSSSYIVDNCYNYITRGTYSGQWYLPALGEINKARNNKVTLTAGLLEMEMFNQDLLSSTENGASYIWGKNKSGSNTTYSKTSYFTYRCMLPLEKVSDNKLEVCRSEYIYRCDALGQLGVGDSCGGMYKSCTCIEGSEEIDGKCCSAICEEGTILYSDGTCNTCVLADKTAIGVVAYANKGSGRLVTALEAPSVKWSSNSVNIANLNNSDGKNNTQLIVDYYGTSVASTTAAVKCYNYTTTGTSVGQWYLPAKDELFNIWDNIYTINGVLTELGKTNLGVNSYHWTSTQNGSSQAYYVYRVADNYANAGTSSSYNYKTTAYNTLCVMAVEDNGDGTINICSDDYKYSCQVANASGKGDACGGLYKACECADGKGWYVSSCIDCDETYKYACTSSNETAGIGETCGGLYTSCTCTEGMEWSEELGKCITDCETDYVWDDEQDKCVFDSCPVGSIYYSDGTCSLAVDSAKTAIGVVAVKDGNKRLVIALERMSNNWSDDDNDDVIDIQNYSTGTSAIADIAGKANTKILLEHYGDTNTYVAAINCYKYSTAGTDVGQWYLGAAGEMYPIWSKNWSLINNSFSLLGKTQLSATSSYWTSSENDYRFAHQMYGTGMNSNGYLKDYSYYIQCMLQVEDNGNNTAKVCGAEYLYPCEGNGYVGGVGEGCGQLYTACECAENYEYYKGRCCDTRCDLGNILYSDGSCSSCRIAGKLPIGIVGYEDGDRRLVVTLESVFLEWSADKTDISSLYNYNTNAIADYSGLLNTQFVYDYYGENQSNNAAVYCYNYIPTDSGWDKGLWYLPAEGELKKIIYDNYAKINSGIVTIGKAVECPNWNMSIEKSYLKGKYWSSTEYGSDYAWFVDSNSGITEYNDKDYRYLVTCVLPINVNDDGLAIVCDDTYRYSCIGDYMVGGIGEACSGLYKDCQCETDYGSYMGKCITCESKYQYNCSGEHIIGGLGYSCGGLYETCECELGYGFVDGTCTNCEAYKYECIPNTETHIKGGNGDKCGIGYSACECEYGYIWSEIEGVCIQDTSCKVGYRYSGGKCFGSSKGNIVYVNGSEFWVISANSNNITYDRWLSYDYGKEATDILFLENYATSIDAMLDDNGRINTKVVVDYYGGESNYSYSAANRCYNQNGRDYSIGRWYLPSVGEAVKIYENKDILGNVLPKYFLTSTEKDEGDVYRVSADGVDVIGKYSAVGNTNNNTHCIMMFNLNDDGTTTLCGSEYLYRCNDAHTSGVGETCAGHYKSCACDEGYGFYVKNCKICEDSFKYACSVGDNHISGGKDYPCGDLYEACECEIGYKWSETDGACVPCGAEYQYECTVDAATHIVGIGEDSCSIYYSSCACDVGYVWSETDGACVCDTSCKVGNILYSDGTCNGCVLEDKTIVGVVGYLGDDNTALLLRAGMISTKWSSNSVDIPGLKNWSSGYLKDMAGAENTQIIVDYYGEDATNNAAVTCHSYSTEGTEAGQWYLPSAGELAKIWETEENYSVLKKRMENLGVNPSYSEYMFSSTEYNASYARQVSWSTYYDKVDSSTISKTSSYYAYCVLPMVINDDGSLDACDAKYKFTCEGEHIVGTVGESCGRWYEGCQCASGYVWENGYCAQTCDWEYQYECVFDELTSITGGVGEGCGGQYTACECAEGYIWSTGLEQCVSTCDIAYEWSEDESQCVCKSDYKYSCIGDKQVGGDGVTCGGSYSACECEVGYVWSNETGACECDSSCAVGQVYYSDGTCSSCVLEDKTAVGVVAYDIKGRKAVVALDSQKGYWSDDNVNIPKLPDISNNTSALDDYRGKYNTSVIVEHYGNDTDTTKNAAVYCANYAPEGMEHTKGKWYLPAAGELNVSVNTNGLLINNVFDALGKLYLGNVYWSSSEYGSYGVYYINNAGGISSQTRSAMPMTRCFLHIGDIEEDKPEVCSMDNQYICGSKTAGGIGEECGGLYTSCSCAEGMVFYNEECCNPKCIPGSIYYHDGTCSSCRIWEKTPIGMVVNDHLVVALKSFNTNWGLENIDIPELRNYATEEEAKTDFNGRANTEILVKYYPGYAADKCNQYTTIGTEAGQWYLPAAGEVFEIYAYYNELDSLFSQFNVSRTNVQMSSTEASMHSVWEGNDSVASNITLGYQLQTTTKNYSNTTGGNARSHLCVMSINLNDDEISSSLCTSDYKYRCDGENASGIDDSCGGLYKSCTCSNGTEQFLKDCVVCEDSYKYSCEVTEDTYITGSNGWSCGGQYESCVCDDAHRWSDDEGACICDTSCSVGNILYSDGSCSSCALEDKTAVGIIAYNDSGRLLAVSLTSTSMKWSSTNDDIPNLPNVVSSANGDFNGKVNTKLIVDFYGKNATDNAAVYCYNYAPETWSETKNSWYLPAAGEVYSIIVTNKEKISKALRTLGLNEFNSSYYNTSTEYSDSKPWTVDSNGSLSYYYSYKTSAYPVLCVLPIEEQDDGMVDFCGDDYVATCDVAGASGKGEVCGDLYTDCNCSGNNGWYMRECVTCADTYKYVCEVTEDNGVVGGAGFSCGGLYADCQCSVTGQRWDEEQGKCRCMDNCAIGNILYSDGTCSSCLLDDKTVIGVIVKNENGEGLVMSKDKRTSYWSSDRSDVSSITNITSLATVQSDYNGKAYTDAIVDKYGVSASSNAAVYCYNYFPVGVENTQGYWYLPAGGEVYNYMYENYQQLRYVLVNILGWDNLDYTFWTSNERDSNYAWYLKWGNATISSVYKTGNSFYVVCMLPFKENADEGVKVCMDYKYMCTNANESLGTDVCGGLYSKCGCAEGYYWSAEEGACLDCSGTDKFKYTCSADVSTFITGGIGQTCGGLYETCTCEDGYGFKDGACLSYENIYVYECVSDGTDNIKGGKGEAYNDKYEACTCGLGYTWSDIDGVCVASSCAIGNILYSDGSCSATVDSSKTAIGVVAYDDGSLKRALALTSSSNKWSSNSVDVPNLTNYSSSSSAQGDKNGKENTRILVEYYGESSTTTAAVTCYNYTTAGTSKGDWYLGSAGEMYEVFVTNKTAVNNALSLLGKSTLGSSDYWTSTEFSSSKANEIYNYNIYSNGETKTNSYKVQCMISF